MVVSLRQNYAKSGRKIWSWFSYRLGTGKEAKPKRSVQPELEMMA